ncbi:hypothetical protein HPB49_012888 [Dermacentor silvarum]|uniref:Uncharacterized protein n=2 Tax=Dermacentor silvarum TaxID=543639 RepID=A0ACB8CL41_DERSI|nr:hypothetical protein HPB49_014928 [Dermacentor silvarum]KAH7945559.1 hypothetical protein HPB49_012888 [Dermacentor silvarum]
MSSQPTQKAYAFDVVVPEGAGPEDVVDATASIVTLEEVYCVQHFGGRNYQVTVKSEAAMAKLVDADSLVIGEERVSIVPLSPQVTQVTVMFLPCRVSSETLAQALAPYGKVISISRGLMGTRPTVTTGTRYVRIEMKPGSPVPNYLRVAGHRVTCDYRGMQRVCRRCGSSGHFRMQCTAPFCTRCGIYGHDGKGCVLPCRRCGDPHATVACSLRRTYSEAASKNFPPLQSSTHDRPSISSASLASTQEDAVQVPAAETPATSPASPDPENHENVLLDETPRPVDIPAERCVAPPASREPAERHVSEAEPCLSVDSDPLVIDETPCHEDDATSLCSEPTSSASTRIEEDITPGNFSDSSPDIFVSPSPNIAGTKRQHGSTSDSDVASRDRSPLRASTRHRKPRASGGSPVRKK